MNWGGIVVLNGGHSKPLWRGRGPAVRQVARDEGTCLRGRAVRLRAGVKSGEGLASEIRE